MDSIIMTSNICAEEKPLVSVGMPVFNVELYIEKSVLSLLNQTYHNLEILIVDDLGTDASIDIVKRLQSNHTYGNQIRIISQNENLGPGEARNRTMDEAKGKYMFFLDSDDYIEPDTITLMVTQAEKYQTDIVTASSQSPLYGTDIVNPAFNYKSFQYISGKDAFANYVCSDLRMNISIPCWNILFSLDFLRRNNLRFAARKDEDALFLSDYYSEVEKAILMPDVTYNYLERPGSIMGNEGRSQIPTREIRERFRADAVMTEHCARLKGRSFYDVHCARVVKHKFRAVCVALRHRHRFTEQLSSSEIKQEFKYPVKFPEIIRFRRYKAFHLFFYFLSLLPAPIFVKAAYMVGRGLKWI